MTRAQAPSPAPNLPGRVRRGRLAALGFALIGLAPLPAHGGAWTLPEGKGQVIVTGTFLRGDRAFGADGRLIPVAEYRKFELTALGEYGVTDWLTAIAAPGLLSTSVGEPVDADYLGPGYQEFGARTRLLRTDHGVLSVQGTARIAGARDDDDPAQIGNADDQVDLRVLWGRGFALGGWTAFADVQAAHRFRSDDPPDEWRLDLTFGVRPTPSLLLLAQSFNVMPAGPSGHGFPQSRYHKLQFSAVLDLVEGWSAQLGVIGTVAGQDALRERGLVGGLWRRF